MTKFRALYKKVVETDHRHFIALFLVSISSIFAILKYSLSYERFAQNIVDFFKSFGYYFIKTYFNVEDKIISLTPAQSIDLLRVVPFDVEVLKYKLEMFGSYFFSNENFNSYTFFILKFLLLFFSILSLLIPIVFLVSWLVKKSYLEPGAEEDRYYETKPLQFFKKHIEPGLLAIIDWCVSFVTFMLNNSIYIKAIAIIWLFNINAFTLVVGILGFYFYFVTSFDITVIPNFLLKMGADVLIMLFGTNVLFWLILAYLIVTTTMKKVAYMILNHHEMQNRGFINAQPLVTMSCGTMGSSKTKSAVDMVLSTSVMFRNKALEILIKDDMKFPNFPWLRFEDDLKMCYENHIKRQQELRDNGKSDIPITDTIYNLASSKYWVCDKAEKFSNNPCIENIWGYDYKKYSFDYDDDLKISNLFEVLIEYSQAYLIYTVQSSLIFGNMPVREDVQMDNGFLPMWDDDFFHKNPVESDMSTRFSHIFDYDMFRLGKKMIENNQNSNAFEFGVVILTEIGKERKNSLENRELKKQVNECNQNNDLFNTTLKMIRHRATVGFYPFVRIVTDEQRPESWGADARDLCSVIHLGETSELKILYKGLFFDSFMHETLYPKFNSFYVQMRNLRGDNTLFVYLLKNVFAWSENRFEKLKNRFGYFILPIETVQGTLDGKSKKNKYFISTKKAHMERYATDTHADLFERMALYSGVGLVDFVCYQNVRQTEDELALQNSFFYLDMTKWDSTKNVA